ncbi:Uncharacterised protein [Mycobacterium tuberculosis]|nr:Uncharacterised protein [Mycobacterium tuberculosis]
MNNSLELTAFRPILGIGRMSTLLRSRSVRNKVMPSVLRAASSNFVVRVNSRTFSDSSALEIHTLRPLTT